jgi:hypothetical protein
MDALEEAAREQEETRNRGGPEEQTDRSSGDASDADASSG